LCTLKTDPDAFSVASQIGRVNEPSKKLYFDTKMFFSSQFKGVFTLTIFKRSCRRQLPQMSDYFKP
jgi:hypothetical protein